jgi:hypothetical protein
MPRNAVDPLSRAATLPPPAGASNLPGYQLHPLHAKPVRYSIHVNGPWCITFEWNAPRALKVDLEQYH